MTSTSSSSLLFFFFTALIVFPCITSALASSSPPSYQSYLVTGGNKGQGYALCKRILSEHTNTHVFLCSRNKERGMDAKSSLLNELCPEEEREGMKDRIDVISLDVTSDDSVKEAFKKVESTLTQKECSLFGIVSNAGILWGYPLSQLFDVCTIGVKRVLELFVPLLHSTEGRVAVVTSGLGPLMHSYASQTHQKTFSSADCTYEDVIKPIMTQCLQAYDSTVDSLEQRIKSFESIGFPGGPFADSAPDFHMYGLSKMLADVYMVTLARRYPNLLLVSVDPGLVYTDLILKMPRYEGKEIGETTAQTPHQGVEPTMRLLFDTYTQQEKQERSGKLFAMNKDKTDLIFSTIDKMPQKEEQ